MSDFITRLVERTLGLSEAVQPIHTPIFANEITEEDGPSATPHLDGKTSDSEEETKASEFSRTEASSVRAHILSEPPPPNKATIPDKPMRSHDFTDSQPDSKNNVVWETDKPFESDPLLSQQKAERELFQQPEKEKQFESDPLVSKQKVERELSPQPKKPQSHDSPSWDKDRKEVTSTPTEKSGNMDLSEKGDTGAVKFYNEQASSMHSAESRGLTKKLQSTEKRAHSLRPLASKRLVRPEVSLTQEKRELAIQDRHSDERKASSTLPAIKVTIGRIEVRAIREQAPSPPRRRKVDPKPKLSLDDYLKQRNRGER